MSTPLPQRGDDYRMQRVLRGVVASGGSQVVQIVAQLALVPLFLATWGVELYGQWLTAFAALSVLVLLDCGIPAYVFNRLTAARSMGDLDEFEKVLQSAWRGSWAVVAIGIFLVGAVLLFMPSTAGWLVWAEADAPVATMLVLSAAILMAIPLGVLLGIYRTVERYARGEVFGALHRLIATVSLSIALALGGGPLAAAATMLFSTVFAAVWAWVDLRRLGLGVTFAGSKASWAVASSFFAPGLGFLGVQAVEHVSTHSAVLLTGLMAGAVAVPALVSLRTLTHLGLHLIACITNPIWPESTAMAARGARERLRFVRRFTHKLVLAASCAFAAWLWVAGEGVLDLWTLGQLKMDRALLCALLLRFVIRGTYASSTMLLLSWSQLRPVVGWGLLAQGLGLAFGLFGGWAYGAAGIVFGAALAQLVTVAWALPRYVSRELGDRPTSSLRDFAVPLGACMVILGTGAGLRELLSSQSAILSMVLGALVIGSVTPVVVYGWWLDADERARIWHWMRPAAESPTGTPASEGGGG